MCDVFEKALIEVVSSVENTVFRIDNIKARDDIGHFIQQQHTSSSSSIIEKIKMIQNESLPLKNALRVYKEKHDLDEKTTTTTVEEKQKDDREKKGKSDMELHNKFKVFIQVF